jgi:hypothetical protein
MTPTERVAFTLIAKMAASMPEVRDAITAMLDADAATSRITSDEPKSRAALKQAAYRRKEKERSLVGNEDGPLTGNEQGKESGNEDEEHGNVAVTNDASLSLSLSEIRLEEKKRERARESESARARAGNESGNGVRKAKGNASGTVTGNASDTVTLTLPLSDELREAAAMTGVKDVTTAWTTFVGHHNGRTYTSLPGGLSGSWTKWCAREVQQERTARERRPYVDQVQPGFDNPIWKIGDGM